MWTTSISCTACSSRQKDTIIFTIFTLPNCRHCAATKRKFNDSGADFEVIDLTENPDQADYIRKQGFTMAPVIEDPYGHLHTHLEVDKLIKENAK